MVSGRPTAPSSTSSAVRLQPQAISQLSSQNFNDLKTLVAKTTALFQNNFSENMPLSVDLRSLRPTPVPADWGSREAATRAAKRQEHVARLMGHVSLQLTLSQQRRGYDVYKALVAEHVVQGSDELQPGCGFDDNGEYCSVQGVIPASRLGVALSSTCDGITARAEDLQLLTQVIALQSPGISQWRMPFIRTVVKHRVDPDSRVLSVRIYLYFSRLLFELISDHAVKTIMDNIQGVPVPVEPVTSLPEQPAMYSAPGRSLLQHRDHNFSLAGIMSAAENTGYAFSTRQPTGLTVTLYDYQLSTLQWMLDRERDPRGLNGMFWERWSCGDGGPDMHYFPLVMWYLNMNDTCHTRPPPLLRKLRA